MKKSMVVVENFANKVIFFLIFFKLNYVLKYFSFKYLYKISGFFAFIFIKFNKQSVEEIKKHQINCFEKEFTSVYFNNLFYNIVLLTVYPYYSDKKNDKLINKTELFEFFDNNKDKRFVIGGLHFFNFISITSIANLFHTQNKKIFASFVLSENKRIYKFIKHVKQKFNYDYHHPFNLATDKQGIDKLKNLYYTTNCNFFIFTDVTFKKKQGDIEIKIGNQNLRFNGGFNFVSTQFSDCGKVIIYLEMNQNYTFTYKYFIIEDSENYYHNEFKKILSKNKECWQMWFFNPIFQN